MARTNAQNIYIDAAMQTKDLLAERYDALIQGIQREAISSQIKNTNLSGDPRAGSVEVSRFANSAAKAYGTARTAGKGDALINSGKVTVNVNVDREIVEEVEQKDLRFKGLSDILADRTRNHKDTVIVDLDTAFFAEAETAATEVSTTGLTKTSEIVDAVIEKITNVKNAWVEGVNRADVVITLDSASYDGLLREHDFSPINETTVQAGRMGRYHGATVYENIRQTAKVIGQRKESIAQPVVMDEYSDPERIPLSNAWATSLFYSYGTKAVTPDLIFKVPGDGASS